MITLSKIAQKAHVSVSTVSKAFSMSSEVNAETREKIFQIAKEFGCFKKYYKAKYPKLVIAVICPEFPSHFYSSALSIIQQRLTELNCEICVASTNFSKYNLEEIFQYYSQYSSVDGIIAIGNVPELDSNTEFPVSTVFLGESSKSTISAVSENLTAFEQAIDYFIDKGVTRIGFIGESNTISKSDRFIDICNNKLGKADLNLISITDERFEKGGYLAMENLFSQGNIPRAIICAYDNMAIGAIRCIYDHGLTVPGDIAIIGMDDNNQSKYLTPSLSSIDFHLDEACLMVTDALVETLRGNPSNMNISIEATLNLRESSDI